MHYVLMHLNIDFISKTENYWEIETCLQEEGVGFEFENETNNKCNIANAALRTFPTTEQNKKTFNPISTLTENYRIAT